MSYHALLNTDEWRLKRIQIIERDNHKCRRCGIDNEFQFKLKGALLDSSYFKENSSFEFVRSEKLNVNLFKLSVNSQTLTCKTSLSAIDFVANKKYIICFNVGYKNQINYEYNGTTLKVCNSNIFFDPNCNAGIIGRLTAKIDNSRFEIDREGFWFIEKEREYEYLKSNSLQVHHKCYRKNIEIWAQNDSEYDSLCNACHRIVHENYRIPFYDPFGNLYEELIPCSRCGGQKYFKCYEHVNGGICFKCGGYGFENTKAMINHY